MYYPVEMRYMWYIWFIRTIMWFVLVFFFWGCGGGGGGGGGGGITISYTNTYRHKDDVQLSNVHFLRLQ